jgi:branched-chain amino acid transport system permease protein
LTRQAERLQRHDAHPQPLDPWFDGDKITFGARHFTTSCWRCWSCYLGLHPGESRFGNVLVAIWRNQSAPSPGYDIRRYQLVAFIISQHPAGWAGCFYCLG